MNRNLISYLQIRFIGGNKQINIGIIDADLLDKGTRFPNLALMKISGYYKGQGNNVKLISDYNQIKEYDLIFLSKVFDYTNIPIDINNIRNLKYGGTGFYYDKALFLKPEIEHHFPDYNLYDEYVQLKLKQGEPKNKWKYYTDYSIGFTTRGCFRKCNFCVNKRFKKAIKWSDLNEFVDINKKYITLLDDNFLAYEGWKNILLTLQNTGKRFEFKQGLDMRLMTEEKARMLSESKYIGDYIFAFDNIEDKNVIKQKLNIWKKYCNQSTKLYVLCAYDSQDVIDIINTFERIKIIMEYGCLPYIMRYKDYEKSQWRGIYINLARWCNQPNFYKKMSFREYCEVNGENSSTMKYMKEFEKEYPEVAKSYFDLKYSSINMF